MYDTVSLWQNGCDVAGGNPFAILPHLCDVTPPHLNKYGIEVASGQVLDFFVYVTQSGISLKGSLCKSYFGDNIHTLQRGDVKKAIEMLNDHLHIDLSSAKVTRIDVATNIPTKRPPIDYYPFFGEKTRFRKVRATDETLYYNNHQRQLVFYDKGKEAKAKGVIVPEPLRNDNLFRYECRIPKRVNRQLKTDVTASTLYDDKFYFGIIQSWYNEFKEIQKLKEQGFMTKGINSKKTAKEGFFAHLIQKEGASIIDEYVNALKADNAFSSRSDYTKLRTELNQMLVAKNGNKTELMQELETTIFSIAKYAR